MYFIPHGNKIYRWAVATQPLVRYAVTVVSLSVIGAAWYYLIYGSLEARKQTIVNTLERNRVQKLEQKKATTDYKELENAIHTTQEKIAQLTHPGSLDIADVLIQSAAQHHVVVKSFTLGKITNASFWTQTELVCDLEGTLENLVSMLTAITKTEGIYTENLTLQHITDGSYHLSCTINLLTAQSTNAQKKSLQL